MTPLENSTENNYLKILFKNLIIKNENSLMKNNGR